MGTVPIFAPDGSLGDVPYERMKEAVAAGGKPGVTIKSPDGKLGVIPAERVPDAAKAGATIVPLDQQETQHAGFWHQLWNDVSSIRPSGVSPYPGMDQGVKSGMAAASAERDQSRKAAGYSNAYRAIAPLAESVGANVSGMEQSAKEGDPEGVLGHAAAVPTVMAATAGLAKGAEAMPAAADALRASPIRPVAKFAGQALDVFAFNRVSKLYGAYQQMRAEMNPPVYPGAPLPEHPGTFPGAPYPENPGTFPGAHLPEVPAPELLKASSLLRGAKSVSDPAAGLAQPVRSQPQYPGAPYPTATPEQINPSLTSPARSLPGQIGKEVVRPPQQTAQPIPARQGLALPPGPEDVAATPTPGVDNTPKTLTGEGALRQSITPLDNATLLKIAKSRGINVTKETQLKAGVANKMLVDKIMDDFSPDELEEIRSQYIENSRFKHAFGDLTPEAWTTMSLQTYFPEVKIPATQLARTKLATAKSPPAATALPKATPPDDMTAILQQSVQDALARIRAAVTQ